MVDKTNINNYNNPWLALSTYEESDKARFKGRGTDIQNMLKMLQQNEYVVCYAASGDGKSSLINAGLCPEMRKLGYFPIKIVFNSGDFDGKTIDLLENGRINFDELISRKIQESLGKCEFEVDERYESVAAESFSSLLWWKLRTQTVQIQNGVFDYIPVLIFDQFEEVLRAKWKNEFFAWLEELSSDECPDSIYELLSEHELIPSDKKFKAVFSMRYEYVGELDYWASQRNFIPQLMHSRYFLKPLSRRQALEIISEQELPPMLKDKYHKEASNILDNINMCADNQMSGDEVSAVILSLVCHILYEKWSFDQSFPISSVGINSVIYEYYMEEIKSIGIEDRVRRVIENTLISSDGNRLRIHISDSRLQEIGFYNYINKNIDKNLLSSHIVKICDNYVELTHDRLAESILIKRKEEDEKINKISVYSKIRFGVFFALFTALIACCFFFAQKFKSVHIISGEDIVSSCLAQDTVCSNPIVINDLNANIEEYDWYNATSVEFADNIHSCLRSNILCYGNVLYLHGDGKIAANAKKIVFHDIIFKNIVLNTNVKDVYIFKPDKVKFIYLANPYTIVHVPFGTTANCISNQAFKDIHFVEMSIFETMYEKLKYEIITQHIHWGDLTLPLFLIGLLLYVFFIIWIVFKRSANMTKKSVIFMLLLYTILELVFLFLYFELYWLGYVGKSFNMGLPILAVLLVEIVRRLFDKKYNLYNDNAKLCIVYHSIEGKLFAQKLRSDLIKHTQFTNSDILLDTTMLHHGTFREDIFIKQVSSIKKVIGIITEYDLKSNLGSNYSSLLGKCKYLLPILYSSDDSNKDMFESFIKKSRKKNTYKLMTLGNDISIDNISLIYGLLLWKPSGINYGCYVPWAIFMIVVLSILVACEYIELAAILLYYNVLLCFLINLGKLIISRKFKAIAAWTFVMLVLGVLWVLICGGTLVVGVIVSFIILSFYAIVFFICYLIRNFINKRKIKSKI